MNTVKLSAAVTVNKGKVRKSNEDNLYLNGLYLNEKTRDIDETYTVTDEPEILMYGVFDGMGGEALGEEASFFAAQTLYEANSRKKIERAQSIDAAVNEIVQSANEKICNKMLETGERRIGTTLALLCVQDDMARIYNVGDSRVYFLRNNELRQISVDDTTGQRLVNMGVITKEQLKTHKDRHRLTQHLGIFKDEMKIEPHIAEEIIIKKGDRFLLCSDGLTDMVDDGKIKEILKMNGDETEITKALVEEALANGGHDNVTAMVITAQTGSKKKPIHHKNKRKTIAGIAVVAFLLAVLAFVLPSRTKKEDVSKSQYVSVTSLDWTTSALNAKEITVGDTGRLDVLYEPANISGEATYESSDSNVISVDEKTGEYIAKSVGKSIVTAKLDDLSIKMEIEVFERNGKSGDEGKSDEENEEKMVLTPPMPAPKTDNNDKADAKDETKDKSKVEEKPTDKPEEEKPNVVPANVEGDNAKNEDKTSDEKKELPKSDTEPVQGTADKVTEQQKTE